MRSYFEDELTKILSHVVHLNQLECCQSYHCPMLIISDQYPKLSLCRLAIKSFQCSKPVPIANSTLPQDFFFKPDRTFLIAISKKCHILNVSITKEETVIHQKTDGLVGYWSTGLGNYFALQKIHSSNPSVITGICDPNKSRARNHRSFNHLLMYI